MGQDLGAEERIFAWLYELERSRQTLTKQNPPGLSGFHLQGPLELDIAIDGHMRKTIVFRSRSVNFSNKVTRRTSRVIVLNFHTEMIKDTDRLIAKNQLPTKEILIKALNKHFALFGHVFPSR